MEDDIKRPQWQLDAIRHEPGPRFMGIPDRWYEEPVRWRCENNHVSTMYLKTEEGARCLGCGSRVWITFPEDRDGPSVIFE